jgi:hypothetical protein
MEKTYKSPNDPEKRIGGKRNKRGEEWKERERERERGKRKRE